ncbi:hypothetical protein Tco_1166297 [Tanacetum coccineum]
MYEVFKGQSSGSVALILALSHIPANVEGDNATQTATEEPKRAILISTIQPTEVPPTQAQPITTLNTHPKISQAASRIDKGKGIATESEEDSLKKLVPASTIVRPDPDSLIPYIINREVYHLTAEQLQEQIDKEELIKKAEEEARLFAISKPESKSSAGEASTAAAAPKKLVTMFGYKNVICAAALSLCLLMQGLYAAVVISYV